MRIWTHASGHTPWRTQVVEQVGGAIACPCVAEGRGLGAHVGRIGQIGVAGRAAQFSQEVGRRRRCRRACGHEQRHEDEREQTLYYLETLNTVEFSCFTNAYIQSHILYQVLIFPSQRSGSSLSSANVWLHLVGSHGEKIGRAHV